MSTVFVTLIVFAIVTLLADSTSLFIKKRKNLKENLLRHLSKEGSANNLVFCSQEILHDKVMGIDGIHRKVMILERIDNNYKSSVISLDEMQSCELKKVYMSSNGGSIERLQIVKRLSKIELQFGFKNNGQPASITFYDQVVNSKRESVLLKAKAEYWSVMLSKMLIQRPAEAVA